MIARLRGHLLEKAPQFVVVDCGGVGYHAFVSLTTFCRLPEPGATVDLVVVTNLRENALELFAFRDVAERDLHRRDLREGTDARAGERERRVLEFARPRE